MNDILILIGDSLTYGFGVSKRDSWAYKLSNSLSSKTINKGINGDTTPSMLNRFYDDAVSLSPKKIFLMGGTNDLLCGRSIHSIIDNIELMIKDSGNAEITIGIPPCIKKEMAEKLFMPSHFYGYCSSNLPVLREKLIALCNNHSVKYVDLYSVTLDNIDNNIFIDGIHLNSLGNNLLFTEILKKLI